MQWKRLALWVWLVVSSIAPGAARAQECIPPSLEASLTACTPGPSPRDDGTVAAAVPAQHVAAAPTLRSDSPPPDRAGPGLPLRVASPTAAAGAELRAEDILRREIETAERIVARLRDGDPRGADYLLRLGDSYAELERAATVRARALDEPIFAAERRAQSPRAAELRRTQARAEADVTAAREHAIRTYARLVEGYPEHPRADEALFALASELEAIQQLDRARQIYMRLIRSHPGSRFVPYAWLAFAEHYFAEGEMDAARQFYERVLEVPADQNPVHAYALYKLAWVHVNLDDHAGALRQFASVLELAAAHPDAHDVESIARQVRREIVIPYAHVGRPSQALSFFRRYATSPAQALEMLESLGELYVDTGQWPEAIQVHHGLMSEAPGSERLCVWQSRVTAAVIASRPKAEQLTEIERLVDVERALRTSGRAPAERVTECRGLMAGTLVELAVAWHREAVGTGEQPGTRDRRTMALASTLYELAIRELPDLETLTLPGVVAEDRPTAASLAYFHAELLFGMEDWARCGPAFDRVVTLEPAGSLTEDAAYAAVLCYDHVYQQGYGASETDRGTDGASSLAPRPLSDGEQAMLAAFHRFACVAPTSSDLPQVLYRQARVYYVANHFEEAAVLFRAVALDHASHELAEFAANLYLDSLNALHRRDASEPCAARMSAELEPLGERHCATERAQEAHADLCFVVEGLRCGFARRDAEALGRAGRHREAAAAYVDVFRRFPGCERLDEVLFDAALHFEAARLVGRAIRVRQVLLERFPESELVRPTLYRVGASYHALAIYGQAASYYEQYARRFPRDDGAGCNDAERASGGCPIAHAALENAVFFRLGLGEEEAAIEDARLYERSFRRARPRETAQVVLALGSIFEGHGDWPRVIEHHRVFLRDYARVALPHQVIRAHVRLGRARWELEQRDEATEHFEAAVAVFARGTVPDERARQDVPAMTDEERALGEARSREAASEALFHLAERRRDDFRALRFPRYAGPSTLPAIGRWSRSELLPWLARKIEALHTAEAAYARVEPLGIPEWRIAAAARVGEMYQDIIDAVRGAPVPADIQDDEELSQVYDVMLEAVLNGSSPGADGQWETEDDLHCSEGVRTPECAGAPIPRAVAAYEHCLGLATRVRWFNRWSRDCERALSEMDRARYPLAAELRGTASFVRDEPAAPASIQEVSAGRAEPDAELAVRGDGET